MIPSTAKGTWKLADAIIGIVVYLAIVAVVSHIRPYYFGPLGNWIIWLGLVLLPFGWQLCFPLWVSRKRQCGPLIKITGKKQILTEAGLALLLTGAVIGLIMLLHIEDVILRNRWIRLIQSDMRQFQIPVVVLMVTLGPISEEIFYRGFLYNSLRVRLPRSVAASAQALLFAVIHQCGIKYSLVLFVVGLFLVGIYEWRKTLLTPIFVHMLHNTVFAVWFLTAIVGYADRPVLGVGLERHDSGCEVVYVIPDSGAEAAGVEVGDVITNVDGNRPVTVEDIISIIWQKEVGDLVEIEIQRGETIIDVEVTLGKEAIREAVLPPSNIYKASGR